jgi:hypothetical protein
MLVARMGGVHRQVDLLFNREWISNLRSKNEDSDH